MTAIVRGADAELADMFADRPTVKTASGSIRGRNAQATIEPDEPRHGGKDGGRSVWLAWEAPADGVVTFDTTGSDFGTVLAAYQLEPADPDRSLMQRLKEVAAAAQETAEKGSLIQFGVESGRVYEIAVDGFGGEATGEIHLRWTLQLAGHPPPQFLQIPPDRALRAGDSVTLTVVYDGEDDDEVAWLFNGSENDPAVAGQQTPTLTLANFQPANVGRYQLRVTINGVSFISPPIELQINSEGEASTLARDNLPDAINSGLVGRANLGGGARSRPRPSLLSVRTPSAVGLARGYNGTQIFNTLHATSEPGEPAHCGVTGGSSYWLAYQPPVSGTLALDTDGSAFDTVLAVYTFEPPLTGYGSLTPVACDNNSGGNGLTSRMNVSVRSGRNYLIVVDGVGGARGLAHLNYQLAADPPPPVAPMVTLHPVSRTVRAGEPVSFTLTAAGTAPLQIQWFKDAVLLVAETNAVLGFAGVRPADAGTYRAVVRNEAGEAASEPAQLSVWVGAEIRLDAAAGQIELKLPARAGMPFVLESNGAVSANPWALVESGVASGESVTIRAPLGNETARFFRFRVGERQP